MTPYFTALIKILKEDESTFDLDLAYMLSEFEKSDICKAQVRENLEFENKIFKEREPIYLKQVVAVECRSKQHLNKCAKVFMPR